MPDPTLRGALPLLWRFHTAPSISPRHRIPARACAQGKAVLEEVGKQEEQGAAAAAAGGTSATKEAAKPTSAMVPLPPARPHARVRPSRRTVYARDPTTCPLPRVLDAPAPRW